MNTYCRHPIFSPDEKKYLEWFAEKFKYLPYDKASSKEESQEMYNKVLEGSKKFGWSKEQAHKMFFTIGNLNTTEGQQIKAIKQAAPDDGKNWCECLYDMGCPTGDCNSGANCDNAGDSPHECGVFGTSDCDGNCD